VACSADVNPSAVAKWTAECRAYRALLRRKREAFWTITQQKLQSSGFWHILSALDIGDVAVLTLLDLSAAFDTVDQ